MAVSLGKISDVYELWRVSEREQRKVWRRAQALRSQR